MPILTANLGLAGPSSTTLFALSQLFACDPAPAPAVRYSGGFPRICLKNAVSRRPFCFRGLVRASVSVSGDAWTRDGEGGAATAGAEAANGVPYPDAERQARWSADWKAARAYNESGLIYKGRVEGFNGGGLLVRFYSLVGFLPFPQLSPSYSCKAKNIQEVAKCLIGSVVPVKVIQADEDSRQLIFSEKEAVWSKVSGQINVGDIFQARVGSVEDYGAFVHLQFPDGLYHLTGLVHVSEVSWDLVQDVRDILSENDEVKVKVINIDSIEDVRINRQGFEKRVVSQDLQLWLSNAPPTDKKFILLARAGRQVQEIQLTTLLDQDGIRKALQRVLERVP